MPKLFSAKVWQDSCLILSCLCCAVRKPGGVPLHGCDRERLGVGCHQVLGVLHVQGHACAVQFLGRGGLLSVAAGACPCLAGPSS